jgi:hypothetical protein
VPARVDSRRHLPTAARARHQPASTGPTSHVLSPFLTIANGDNRCEGLVDPRLNFPAIRRPTHPGIPNLPHLKIPVQFLHATPRTCRDQRHIGRDRQRIRAPPSSCVIADQSTNTFDQVISIDVGTGTMGYGGRRSGRIRGAGRANSRSQLLGTRSSMASTLLAGRPRGAAGSLGLLTTVDGSEAT